MTEEELDHAVDLNDIVDAVCDGHVTAEAIYAVYGIEAERVAQLWPDVLHALRILAGSWAEEDWTLPPIAEELLRGARQ